MNLKLSKSHAERALRAVVGSASGMEVIKEGTEYAVVRGVMSYRVNLEDMWPSVPQIRVRVYFAGQEIKTVYIESETFKPDWATTAREEREKSRREQA